MKKNPAQGTRFLALNRALRNAERNVVIVETSETAKNVACKALRKAPKNAGWLMRRPSKKCPVPESRSPARSRASFHAQPLHVKYTLHKRVCSAFLLCILHTAL